MRAPPRRRLHAVSRTRERGGMPRWGAPVGLDRALPGGYFRDQRMPRIFDNIEHRLRPALAETMRVAHRADFCVGYFNLRGWRSIDAHVDGWAGGPGHCCRILVGMQRLPHEELRAASTLSPDRFELDNQAALRLKKGLAEQFREQLTFGAPTNQDEAGLRKLARQIRARKVVVRLFLRHPLHAKLYLLFRSDLISPAVAYLGSSNLTQSGLSLSQEARAGLTEFRIPRDFGNQLGGKERVRGEVKTIFPIGESARLVIHALLNSTTYYVFFNAHSDGRHINPGDVYDYPLDLDSFDAELVARLEKLSGQLQDAMMRHKSRRRKSGLLIDSVDSKACKPIIDRIDGVLARHYGFTEDELDFIINYDIKYRMGWGTVDAG